jgi:condensin-2 complex subunit H2
MPARRKKNTREDMDVDSDPDDAASTAKDAAARQKKATEKFMKLLKPIKDAALAFDVDVDEALEDYVEACVRYVEADQGAQINFAEAGLLLQGSAVVYGRKVDGVHSLVYRVLELLRTGQQEKEKADKKAEAGEEESDEEEEPLDLRPENALAPLKPGRAGKNIDLDESKEKGPPEAGADPLVAMLFRDTDQDAPFFGASFCEDGSLRLPGLESDGALTEAPVLVEMMDVEAPLVEMPVEEAFAPPPDDDDDDGFAPGGDDDDGYEPPAEEEEAAVVPADDPWEELDPLAADAKPRLLRRGRTWRAPREDGDTAELPAHVERAPSDTDVAALCAVEAAAGSARDRKLAAKRVDAALAERAALTRAPAAIPELVAAVALEEKRARQADLDDDESVEDAWDGRGRRATFARLFSNEVPLEAEPEDDDQSFGPIGGFDDDLDDGGDADAVQEACQQHLDELAGAVASYAQLARIADRVAQWQERLAPILAAQEAGPPFDILALGRDVVAAVAAARAKDCRVSNAKPRPVGFAHLARGRERSGVCRQFLATLQLANNGNVLLGHAINADVLAPVAAFTVDLLTQDNAHENLASGAAFTSTQGAFTRVRPSAIGV